MLVPRLPKLTSSVISYIKPIIDIFFFFFFTYSVQNILLNTSQKYMCHHPPAAARPTHGLTGGLNHELPVRTVCSKHDPDLIIPVVFAMRSSYWM